MLERKKYRGRKKAGGNPNRPGGRSGCGFDIVGLKAQVPISQVVAAAGINLKKRGREYQGLCPFHTEKTPSFTVNDKKQFYHCFGCGAHGSVIDFAMAFYGLDFVDAVERLGGQKQGGQPKKKRSVYSRDHSSARIETDAERWAKYRLACQLWQGGQPFAGSLAERYLVEGRGICPDLLKGMAAAWGGNRFPFRFLPSLGPGPYYDARQKKWVWAAYAPAPTLLTALTGPIPSLPSGKAPGHARGFAGLHLTRLSDDGVEKRLDIGRDGKPHKAKRMVGFSSEAVAWLLPVRGGCVHLGEGVESSLSIPTLAARGLGCGFSDGDGLAVGLSLTSFPTSRLDTSGDDWAARPTGVVWWSDNEKPDMTGGDGRLKPSSTSQARAQALKAQGRLGLGVDVVIPPLGCDPNDWLREGRHAI